MTDTAAPQPMTDADVSASPNATASDLSSSTGGSAPNDTTTLKQTFADKTSDLRGQATDKVRQFADDGKAKATGALDDLAKMLSDAADQVDEKLGGQFGQYARSTADHVQGFSSSLNKKSVDDLLEMGREFVRKSPAAAIGIATALGFVVARLAAAGLEQRDQA